MTLIIWLLKQEEESKGCQNGDWDATGLGGEKQEKSYGERNGFKKKHDSTITAKDPKQREISSKERSHEQDKTYCPVQFVPWSRTEHAD